MLTDSLNNFSIEFRYWVRDSIKLIITLDESPNNERLLEMLVSKNIPKHESFEIITFLPIAATRVLLAEIFWSNTYIDFYSSSLQIPRKFKENKRFQIMLEEVELFLSTTNYEISENFLKLAGRSAEFQTINSLLLRGGKLEDLILTDTIIIRNE